jgi:membrane-associated phospholipid phosphatase
MGFTAVVLAYSASSGVPLDSDSTVVFLLGAPLVGLAGFYKPATRAWVALLMVVLSYEAIAGPIDSLADSGRILSLFDFDKYLWGFNLTGWVQSVALSKSMTDVTYVLYEALIPFIAVASALIWRSGRSIFARYATAMLLTSYAALLTFLLVPTAPPWYSGAALNLVQNSGIGSTTAYLGPLAVLFQPDYYASFPSMHATFSVICSYFLLKARRGTGVISLGLTGGILFSTLYLGQHFLIDLGAGAAYALVPCLISERWRIV